MPSHMQSTVPLHLTPGTTCVSAAPAPSVMMCARILSSMSTMRPPTMAQAHQLMLSQIRARASGDASLRASPRVPPRFALHLNRICGTRVAGWRAGAAASAPPWKAEGEVQGMTDFLDSLKWNSDGLVAVIVQHVDTGELLMQAFADRNAICETLQTGLATFYSRSRQERWCKGETSGNFITVFNVYADCDRDSIIYLSSPAGPSCHTGARTCWFSDVAVVDNQVVELGEHKSVERVPRTSLYALEKTIADRRGSMVNPAERPSWTAKLLQDPELLCKKVREEADELCRTWEQKEGRERTASEMADLLYHAMVLLNVQGVEVEEVLAVLRRRFGTSGIDEKASRSS